MNDKKLIIQPLEFDIVSSVKLGEYHLAKFLEHKVLKYVVQMLEK